VDVDDPSEVGVRAGFVLMLSLAAVSGWVGLESILGAFLAGALFSYVFRNKGILETKLSAVGQGFFVPLFFINVGVSFEMDALGDVTTLLSGLGALAGASLAAKLIPAFLLIFVGLTLRQVVSSAFLLAAPLTLLVAAAEMGHELGVLDDRLSAEIILLAIVSGVVFPTVFKLLCPRPKEAEPAYDDKSQKGGYGDAEEIGR
jgi:Kef-type K+ transport system membrane component KefB